MSDPCCVVDGCAVCDNLMAVCPECWREQQDKIEGLQETLRRWAYESLVIGTHRSCDCIACEGLRQTVIDMEVSDG